MELPSKDTTEVVKNLITAGGIILGGIWAFWRWSLSEYIRRRRELPSFDGEMSARSANFKDGKEVLTVGCKWRNVGVVPLKVNTQATCFTLFDIPDGTQNGPIGPRLKNLRELFVRRPWEHWPGAILEPATNSELQAHFLVERGGTYVVSCRLEALTKPGALKQVWVREIVWKSAVDPEHTPPSMQVTS